MRPCTRRLKKRAVKGAKDKKSKTNKSGTNVLNIFNTDHKDAIRRRRRITGSNRSVDGQKTQLSESVRAMVVSGAVQEVGTGERLAPSMAFGAKAPRNAGWIPGIGLTRASILRDYACDGDLGYGCRPKIGNWLTVKFVQNPGYEHGPRICGPKCQEVVLIGAGDFEWLFKTNNDGLKGCIVAKMILPTEERGALWSAPPSGIAPLPDVDHMAECQPDPSL
ncbi:hypothetical protein THAOC_27413 [Thalassiosira oceanica]|uniref:Uncharacterized protein n=1 Tax=Thalassiosira oceanica TaxID=159749 RepID=K0RLS4_THAOC|nr:hypothetical protein THAOC_27413 [Thalassiosira oceanica]|eukprot:EJK53204.1 hypothetical protein THAOC_27413 [Thalassiosira oceanica]